MSDILGGMPTYRSQVQIQPPGIVQVPGGEAYGALASSMDRLSRAFNDVAEPIIQAESQREGRSAVEFGEDGRPRAPQLRNEVSSSGRAFNAAAIQQYQDQSEMYWSTQFQTLRAQHRDDPQAFMAAGRAMVEGASQQMPEAYRGQITGRLMQVLQAHTRGVTADMQQRVERQANQAWQMAYTQQADELEAYAVNGQLDSPEARALMGRTVGHIEAGVRAGHLSPEMARLEREALADRVMAHGIAGQAERIAREQGLEAGERFLVERLSEADVAAAGTRAISAARAEGARRLGLLRQGRETEQQEVRDLLSNTRNTIAAQGTPSASSLEANAVRATRAGLPIVAAEFRALANLTTEARTWQGMTLPQLQQQLAEATRRSVTEGDANETGPRMRMIASMIQRRFEMFSRDPIAAVHTTDPEISSLAQRVDRGEAPMSELIRRQDEAIRANGFDPTGAPVMSRGAAEGLVRRVAALPIGDTVDPQTGQRRPGAASTLAAEFARYGEENRARLWDTMRQAQMPEALRAVTVLMAAPTQADAMRRYMTIVAEPDGLQRIQRALPEGEGPRLNDAIRTAMEPFRRTQSGTTQDLGLLNDTERVVTTLATEAMSRGVGRSDAVREAVRQVVEQGWRVVENGSRAAWRVPSGVEYNDAMFRRVTQDLLRPGVLENVRLRVPDGAIANDLTPDERQRAYRESLLQSGSWRSAPDGRGATLMNSAGQPVFMEDGRPFTVRFDEVRDGTYPSGAPSYLRVRPSVGVLQISGDGYFARITAQESRGVLDARNPRSTATGPQQFINGTWFEFARQNWTEVSRAMGGDGTGRPTDLGTPQNPTAMGRAVLAMRTDPMLSLRATHWLANQSAAALGRAGVPVADWSVALAHGVGAGAAPAVIRADPNASVESALTAAIGADRARQTIEANPNWRTMTAGQMVNYYQRRFGDGQTFRDLPVIGAAPRQQVASAAPAPGVRREDMPPATP